MLPVAAGMERCKTDINCDAPDAYLEQQSLPSNSQNEKAGRPKKMQNCKRAVKKKEPQTECHEIERNQSIKTSPSSKALSSDHKPNFCCLAVMTSPYK
jgi:hypothetical protein